MCSAKNAGDAHPCFLVGATVANHQVVGLQATFLAVEGYKRSALRKRFYHHFAALNRVDVEGVQRLAELVTNEIRNVDNIVDGREAYGAEAVLQPDRRFLHRNVA